MALEFVGFLRCVGQLQLALAFVVVGMSVEILELGAVGQADAPRSAVAELPLSMRTLTSVEFVAINAKDEDRAIFIMREVLKALESDIVGRFLSPTYTSAGETRPKTRAAFAFDQQRARIIQQIVANIVDVSTAEAEADQNAFARTIADDKWKNPKGLFVDSVRAFLGNRMLSKLPPQSIPSPASPGR